MEQSPSSANQSPLFVPRLVWGALIFSSFMYSTILASQTPPEEPSTNLLLPMAMVGLMTIVMSFVLPGVIAKGAAKSLEPASDLRQAQKRFFTPFILRMALADSVCILGLVVGFGAGIKYYYPFWAGGLVAMLAAFPTEASIWKLAGGRRGAHLE